MPEESVGGAMTRRGLIRLLVGGAAFAALGGRWSAAASGLLVPAGDDRFFTRLDTDTNTRIIEGIDFVLDPTLLPATSNVIVRGYQITVATGLSLPGGDITIFARELVCKPGAAISTAGYKGQPSYSIQTAAPAVGLGSPGNDGATRGSVQGVGLHPNVGDGGHGGNITIITALLSGQISLDASGGAGGDAESGSDGAPGKPGADATPTSAGQQGGAGGIGGKAGQPGNGGDSGNVWFGLLGVAPAGQGTMLANGGAPGVPGHNGHSGAGGRSGLAGSGQYWHMGMCAGSSPTRPPAH
jgi:hypothetical protein